MKPTQFTGTPKLRPAALPRGGQTMIQDPHFARLKWPAKFLPKMVVGEAIRLGRIL